MGPSRRSSWPAEGGGGHQGEGNRGGRIGWGRRLEPGALRKTTKTEKTKKEKAELLPWAELLLPERAQSSLVGFQAIQKIWSCTEHLVLRPRRRNWDRGAGSVDFRKLGSSRTHPNSEDCMVI